MQQGENLIELDIKDNILEASFFGKEIITGKGFFTYVQIDKKEILTGDLSSKILRISDEEIYAAGFSEEEKFFQALRFKKKFDEIEIEANLYTKSDFKNLSFKMSLELSGDYREFTDSFTYRKKEKKKGVCFEGWPVLRYIGARGGGLPPLYFFIPEGVWYNFARIEISEDKRIILSFVAEVTGDGKKEPGKYLLAFNGRICINNKPKFSPCKNNGANEFYRTNLPYANRELKEGNLDINERLEREAELLRMQLPPFVAEKEIEIFTNQVKDENVRTNYLNYVTSRRDRACYVLKRIYPLVPRLQEKKVLEFGAGHGVFSNYLHSNGLKATGFDIFSSNISKVEGKAPFVVARGEELSYKSNTFDIVILWDIIEHLWMKNAQERGFSEINRVLKKGGLLILSAPNKFWPWDDEAFLFGVRYLPQGLADWYVRIMKKAADLEDRKGGYDFKMRTLRGYKKLFAETGFLITSIEIEKFVIFGFFERFTRIISYLSRKSLNFYPGYLICLMKEREVAGNGE